MATPTGATILRKTSDETVNDNTLQDDDDLKIAMAANEVWYFEGMLFHVGNSTANFKFAFTVPSGATLQWAGTYETSSDAKMKLVEASGTAIGSIGADTSNSAVLFKGEARNGSTAGDLQLQWAQDTTNAVDTKVLIGSWMIGVKEA
jgi:hypothetical protein